MSITAYIRHLTNLQGILEKAKAWQQDHKVSDETMLSARLSLDQFTLAQQVRGATNFAKQTGAALCNVEAPIFEDKEASLQELQSRIDTVITFLSGLSEASIATDLETRLVPLAWMPGKGLTAKYYVEYYAHSNFYFHYTTAYAILRHYGVQIGKADYMGASELKDLA
jgi:hypothetical protein